MTEEELNARALLFDRLVDLEPTVQSEARPFRSLDRSELRESVRRELERLFNTRASVPVHRLEERERTVIDYGIPDFGRFHPGNPEDQDRLAGILARTVEAFEPRLREVKVSVQKFREEEQALWARVDGVLVVDEVREPISFPAVIHSAPGASEVHPAG